MDLPDLFATNSQGISLASQGVRSCPLPSAETGGERTTVRKLSKQAKI